MCYHNCIAFHYIKEPDLSKQAIFLSDDTLDSFEDVTTSK